MPVGDLDYDPVGDVLRVRFEWRERIASDRELDFFRSLAVDDKGELSQNRDQHRFQIRFRDALD